MAKARVNYRVELHKSRSNKHYYKIVSTVNGQTCSTSEMYSRPSGCSKSAHTLAADAGWPVIDKTKE